MPLTNLRSVAGREVAQKGRGKDPAAETGCVGFLSRFLERMPVLHFQTPAHGFPLLDFLFEQGFGQRAIGEPLRIDD